ncbi:hypothetical protein ABR738_00250 [Streptomyces sp. Edi4]|uniref:hypothetical protein n=1 Tax=Streptomyces sp. Edi4 TaxID=3162527 RepID=UPI0033056784
MIERRQVTDAVAALLSTGTGKPCGVGSLPVAAGTPATPPYTVLYSLPLTLDGAPLTDLCEDAFTVYQVSCIARSHAQAEWLADLVRAAVLARDPALGEWRWELKVPGWLCWLRELDSDAGIDADPGAAIVSYVIRFRLGWTLAG